MRQTNKWENVDHLDEHSINLIQLFNRETNEMLIVTEECDAALEFIHLKTKPTFDEYGVLSYLEDCEEIKRKAYKADETYKAFLELIALVI